jgi:hypothetical protein
MININIIRVLICGFLTLSPSTAFAYIGPGMGVGAFVVTFALLIGVIFLVFSLIWFPLKRRFLSKNKNRK